MSTPLIIANWKSHKTTAQIDVWFQEIASAMPTTRAQVVLCPPFPYLSYCKRHIERHHLSWKIGAQNVSAYAEGKHTGEVNAIQLKEFAEYVLIGHSERRNELGESDEMLFEKVKRVQEVGLTPIFFVQGEETPIPSTIGIVAYEPVFAIGTGHADTPEDAEKVARFFKMQKHVPTVLYGGSVDERNIEIFLSCASIDGVVPGTASLDPKEFVQLIHNA